MRVSPGAKGLIGGLTAALTHSQILLDAKLASIVVKTSSRCSTFVPSDAIHAVSLKLGSSGTTSDQALDRHRPQNNPSSTSLTIKSYLGVNLDQTAAEELETCSGRYEKKNTDGAKHSLGCRCDARDLLRKSSGFDHSWMRSKQR